MYILDNDNLRLRVLQYHHNHVLAGHLGQNKTLELIWRHYTWLNIHDNIQKFHKSCVTCMWPKPQHHRLYGSLQQLPIPECLWNSISMDFIEKLPSSSSFDTILVIVDRLSKQAIFIPTHDTIISAELARLFVTHVFSKYRVLSHVTSNCGFKFVSHFFRSLGTTLDMRLHFTSGYHLEANGQVERTNQILEQYLHVYCNYQQDNWSELLPLAEFAYNNAPSTTTGVSPFFANKGYHPNLLVYPERDIASSHAHDFVVNLDELQGTLKEEIAKAQMQCQPSADSHWQQPLDFQVGQPVFIKSQYFWTTYLSKKLSEKYLGPYEIIAQPSLQSFTLHLPDTIRAVHPVFHVSMLEPTTLNNFQQHSEPLPVPVIIDREPEYEISKIVDSKIDHQRACKLLYKVIWLEYMSGTCGAGAEWPRMKQSYPGMERI